MRVPLVYPKIPGSGETPDGRCIAFEKYDGTNLHWVWQRELGWYAFGVRRQRYDLDERGIAEFRENHTGLETAPDLFLETLADDIGELFENDERYREDELDDSEELTVFTEFLGPNSFAGRHAPDDPKELVLIDVETANGILGPERFLDDFGDMNAARVIYEGKLTGRFTEDVRNGAYDVFEGVICKEANVDYNPQMAKIKTNAYLEKLKDAFADDWQNYWE